MFLVAAIACFVRCKKRPVKVDGARSLEIGPGQIYTDAVLAAVVLVCAIYFTTIAYSLDISERHTDV